MTNTDYEKTQTEARLRSAAPVGRLLADAILCQERDGLDRSQEIIRLAHKFVAVAGKQGEKPCG